MFQLTSRRTQNGDLKNTFRGSEKIEETLLENVIFKMDNGFKMVYRDGNTRKKDKIKDAYGILAYFKGLGPWQPYMIVKVK